VSAKVEQNDLPYSGEVSVGVAAGSTTGVSISVVTPIRPADKEGKNDWAAQNMPRDAVDFPLQNWESQL
jgi:hypothetical protein